MILYVNSCVRAESRTNRLAQALIDKLLQEGGMKQVQEVNLEKENLERLNEDFINRRNDLLDNGRYDDDMFRLARQFAEADVIVIGAPYWENAFPSSVKTYLERIFVMNVVTRYREDGSPEGLCRARAIYYVVTSGGPYTPDFSCDYIRNLAETYWGIDETVLIKAENMDVWGNDPEAILAEAINNIEI